MEHDTKKKMPKIEDEILRLLQSEHAGLPFERSPEFEELLIRQKSAFAIIYWDHRCRFKPVRIIGLEPIFKHFGSKTCLSILEKIQLTPWEE